MLQGLSTWKLSNDDIFVQAIDVPYTVASAQAFMQALYPPYSLPSTLQQNQLLDPSSLSSNGSYVEGPMGGYQYSALDTVGTTDPYVIYLTGTSNCDMFTIAAAQYYNTQEFNTTESEVRPLYQSLGHAVLEGILPQSQWGFDNAYMIYDYISYQYRHNATAYELLQGTSYQERYEQLYPLASQKQWEIYGDKSISGLIPGDQIRTVGGQTLAARIAGLLLNNVRSGGAQTVSIILQSLKNQS